MKRKKQKENKVQKETRPVKKSVALVLTIVTVFAFAAACFSLGFCSGKKVNETYAATTERAAYRIEKGEYKGINTPIFSGPNINQAMTFQANNITYQQMRIRPAKGTIVYWDEALESGYMAYDGGWRENSADIYLFEDAPCSSSFYNWFLANFEKYVPSSYTCTLDEKTTGMYSFGYIEGEGVTYNHESGTMEGPADSTFQVQLMPFEGYMVDTFTVTDSDGTAKSIVKNSDTLYTITFDSEDFVLNISATVKEIEYTLTCEYEGAQNYTVVYGVIGDITREGDVFTGQPGASVYVRITPKDGYIMRNLSYQITDGSVASVTPGSSNNYTIVLTSSDATILFSVVATVQTVDISSGYYWIQSRVYGSDFPELTLQPGEFQIVESISNGSITWQDLTGLTCSSGRITFRLTGDRRISVYTITSVTEEYGLTTALDSQGAGWITSGNYDYNTTLWSANWYPVIYVPSNIMEGEAPDSLVAFLKSTSIYKAEPVFYNGMYLTSKSTVNTVDPLYNTYLSAYVPSSNTLVSPSGISFVPRSAQVLDANFKSQLAFVGDVGAREYSIYTGYVWQENGTSVGYSRVGRIPPVSNSGTYEESIYIAPTIMPASLYDNMSNWFDISVNPAVPVPPPSSYWDGLDEVLGYEIFGIPLSSLLAIVISSVFVVVVIRLFAGG